MSAQAGAWNFDGGPVDQAFLGKLGSAIEQYGPDGGKAYINGSIGMVYRAFHTTFESRAERQPYVSYGGNIITWDGRLDNREDLVPQLYGDLTPPSSQTDIGLVAAAFERWGCDCFRRLIGEWAVCIWGPVERELILAVDYMAVRHIFYYAKKDRIWWSTELAPLVLLSDDKFHIDDNYISGYFAHEPEARLTPYREISEAPPGHFVRVHNDGSVSICRYWSPSPKSWIRYKTDAEYEEHFRHVFRQAVRRRLRADKPVVAELSGGLDSSSIVCMADDILANGEAQTPRLDTLSYYDKTEPKGDDWIYFPKIEQKRGRVGAHLDASKLGSSLASFESPEFTPLPGYFGGSRQLDAERASVVRERGYRAVLSGIGGDEFLGGIPDPRALLADLMVQFKFVTLAKQLMAWSLVKRIPLIQLFWQSLIILFPSWLAQYVVNGGKVEPWIESEFTNRTKLALPVRGSSESFGLWLPSRRSRLGGVFLMANKLAKFRTPMLAPEETRYPYLDQNLIEFILSIPASQLLRPGERRSLMGRSLVGIVPQEILSRRTKQFGARTLMVAVERNVEQFQMAFQSPLSTSLGYINQSRFLEIVNGARNGQRVHIGPILKTISLEFWLRDLMSRRLIDGITLVPPPLRSASLEASALTGTT